MISSPQGLVVDRQRELQLQATQQEAWIQLGADIDGEDLFGSFGSAVDLSSDGTVLAVGAFAADGAGFNWGSGHVRVFKYANNIWTQWGADIDGEAAYDSSGFAVSLSSDGTVLAVGAPNNAGKNGSSSGHVRVYKYANSKWTQRGADIDGEAAGDLSGQQVSLSSDGNILVVTASDNKGTNGEKSGHARVYKYANNAWTQMGADIDGEASGDYFGNAAELSSDGTVLAVGSYNNDGNGSNSGHVRVYEYANSMWTQRGADIDGEAAEDASGLSVSLSSDGMVVAVGAYLNDGSGAPDSGHVRVFRFANSAWTQMGGDIDGEAAGDQSGTSVSLSSDGTVLAVGAWMNAGNGGYESGHVRVYKYSTNNNAWTQLGVDINGEAACDWSGYSVSLSSDGTVLAVGAPYNGGALGLSSGHVRVFKFTTMAPSTPKPTNKPTKTPTNKPIKPTKTPTNKPTTKSPTNKPTSKKPTSKPTSKKPTNKPTKAN